MAPPSGRRRSLFLTPRRRRRPQKSEPSSQWWWLRLEGTVGKWLDDIKMKDVWFYHTSVNEPLHTINRSVTHGVERNYSSVTLPVLWLPIKPKIKFNDQWIISFHTANDLRCTICRVPTCVKSRNQVWQMGSWHWDMNKSEALASGTITLTSQHPFFSLLHRIIRLWHYGIICNMTACHLSIGNTLFGRLMSL